MFTIEDLSMKASKWLAIFPLFMLAVISNPALAYEIEINSEKKIIHVSELTLPKEMTLLDFLQTLPELVDRDADSFLGRYDVAIHDKVLSESKDAFLANTFLRDIEKIEISTSPSDSHIKNGISGTVNIVPAAIEKGFGGDVNVQTSITSGVMPTMNLHYSDGGKFEALANLNFDIYYPTRYSYVEEYSDNVTLSGADTTRERYFGQLARIYAKWTPTPKDILKIWLWQNFSTDYSSIVSGRNRIEDMSWKMGPGWQYSSFESSAKETTAKNLAFTAIVDYTRKVKTGDLGASANYRFYSRFPGKSDELNLELKSVSNLVFPSSRLNIDAKFNSSINSNRDFVNRMVYISPNLTLKYNTGNVEIKVKGRYKGYARKYSPNGGKMYSGWSHDWTADAYVFWQIVDHHALRLKLIRNTSVADNSLVYPELVYDSSAQAWRKGNPDLKGPVTNSAHLEYITDWTDGAHRIVFSICGEYDYQDRRITNSVLFDPATRTAYLRPSNMASSNVVGAYSMLRYSYGAFAMTLGGNYFYNMENSMLPNLKASYFNVQFNPSVKLRNDWILNASFIYNSKVFKQDATIGDCSLLNLRVSKLLGNWTLYASIQDVFDCLSTDTEKFNDRVVLKTYDPYMRQFVIGANLHF